MAPIAPAHSPFFSGSNMQNSEVAAAAAAAAGAASTASSSSSPTLESLSMTLATRTPDDYVNDAAKLEKMAAAVQVLLEVRT